MRRVSLLLAVCAVAVLALLLSTLRDDESPGSAISNSTGLGTWEIAHSQFVDLNAGAFELTKHSTRCDQANLDSCEIITLTLRKHGSFSLNPNVMESEETFELLSDDPGRKESRHINWRRLADGSTYLRDDVFRSTPCWQATKGGYAEYTEADFRASLEVLRSATVPVDPPASDSPSELRAVANALAVVRLLGVEESRDEQDGVTDAIRRELAATTVPLTLLVNSNGAPAGFQISGRAVSAALTAGREPVTSNLYFATAQNASVEFALRDHGKMPTVQAPPADQIPPADAKDIYDCPASR